MNVKLLPQLMQDALKTLEDLHNTPFEMGIQAVLGVANLAVQGHYNVDSVIYGLKPISLFCVGLAKTGAAKTTIANELSKGIDRFEEEDRIRFSKEKADYELDKAIVKKKKEKKIAKEASANINQPIMTVTPVISASEQKENLKAMLSGLTKSPAGKPMLKNITTATVVPITKKTPSIAAIIDDDEIVDPEPPRGTDYRLAKATVNGIIDTLLTQPTCSLFSSEAGEFFNSHAFQTTRGGATANEMCASLTSLWDGNVIDRQTGICKTKLYHRRFSMLFLLQMAMAQEFLSNTQFSDQGFTHRLLITHTAEYEKPDMDVTEKGIARIKALKDSLEPFHNQIYGLMKRPFRCKENSKFELDPETLTFDQDALELLADYYNKNKNRGTKDMKNFSGFADRLHEQALRIAATLAAFEMASTINLQNAQAGIELVEFYCDQRKTMEVGSVTAFPMLKRNSDQLYDWLVRKNWSGSTALTPQSLPAFYKPLVKIERQALWDELVGTGKITIEPAVTSQNKTTNKVTIL